MSSWPDSWIVNNSSGDKCNILYRALYRIVIYQLYRYFGCMIHMVSFILVTRYNDTFLLKFRVFWWLKFPNSHEICGYIYISSFFGLKPDKMYYWYISNIASCVSCYVSYHLKSTIWSPNSVVIMWGTDLWLWELICWR